MTTSATTGLQKKMSWKRAKSPGWAAFDIKQREKQAYEGESDNGPFPPISNSVASLHPSQNFVKNNDLSVRSFSSVLLPSVNFRTFAANKDSEKPLLIGNSSMSSSIKLSAENKDENNATNNVFHSYKLLKELHEWADKSLIEDVMSGVNNDFDKASALLKVMVSSGNFEDNKEMNTTESKSRSEDLVLNNYILSDNSVGHTIELAKLSCVLEGCFNCKEKELINNNDFFRKMLPDGGANMKPIFSNSRHIPVETEWEEADIYLIHRKDAMKMMRSASRHSRAATDAYLRGDHYLAQQFSLKAHEEWMATERFNAKAAKDILSIRNRLNDMWTLDLHGLHAAEAVQALQEHLQKVESLLPFNHSLSPIRVNGKAGIVCSACLESSSSMNMKKLDEQQASSRQRLTSLQVITGIGNHSRGEAAIPKAIKNFLCENW